MNQVHTASDLSNVMERSRAVHTFKIPAKLAAHGIKSIGLVELTAEEELTASKMCGDEPIRLGRELTLQSLRFINGIPVSAADGSLQRAFTDMHPKVRHLTVKAYASIHNPDEDESEGFLQSREQSRGLTFPVLCLQVAPRGRSRAKNIWKLLAFLGRYCHQSVPEMMRSISVNQLIKLRDATAEYLEEERAQNKPPGDDY